MYKLISTFFFMALVWKYWFVDTYILHFCTDIIELYIVILSGPHSCSISYNKLCLHNDTSRNAKCNEIFIESIFNIYKYCVVKNKHILYGELKPYLFNVNKLCTWQRNWCRQISEIYHIKLAIFLTSNLQ